ncbi:MAG: tyrosine recombinase XerD [Chloroflexi bacterium]|nr:MAG: tyrosine recombinase XerD [Chloroflexota bacterium]RLC96717.1 MAG: tyrosine recombinase XerD [Chloroflexota bacterium]
MWHPGGASLPEGEAMRQEIEAFLGYLANERGFSENTAAAYRNDLFQLVDFLQEKGVTTWSEVDRQLILSYLLDLKQRGYALTTVARKTASTKSLFKFLVAKGIRDNTPTENLGSPRVKKSSPQPLSVAQVKALMRQPGKYHTPEAKRDKAMLELLYGSGMQIRELMALNLEDVTLDGDRVSYFIRGSRGRRGEVHRDTVPSLEAYLREARPQLAHREGERALFLNRLGERLTRQGFWQIIKGYAREAKLDSQVTLRALRHSFAAHSPVAET